VLASVAGEPFERGEGRAVGGGAAADAEASVVQQERARRKARRAERWQTGDAPRHRARRDDLEDPKRGSERAAPADEERLAAREHDGRVARARLDQRDGAREAPARRI